MGNDLKTLEEMDDLILKLIYINRDTETSHQIAVLLKMVRRNIEQIYKEQNNEQ